MQMVKRSNKKEPSQYGKTLYINVNQSRVLQELLIFKLINEFLAALTAKIYVVHQIFVWIYTCKLNVYRSLYVGVHIAPSFMSCSCGKYVDGL